MVVEDQEELESQTARRAKSGSCHRLTGSVAKIGGIDPVFDPERGILDVTQWTGSGMVQA